MRISKSAMILAFARGVAFPPLGLRVINSIEREDGSNQSYNVTGISMMGHVVTLYVRTI